MVGNSSSTASIAIAVMALHATMIPSNSYHGPLLASAADVAGDNGRHNRQLRKRPHSTQQQLDLDLNQNNDHDEIIAEHGQQLMGNYEEPAEPAPSTNTQSMHITENIIAYPPQSNPRKLASCGTAGWHPDVTSGKQDGCSNDDNYPQEWYNGALKSQMFHGSSKACCDFFFPKGGCVVYDRCGGQSSDAAGGSGSSSGGSSSDCAWHANMETQNGCINDDNYPNDWLDKTMINHMFHTTPKACCSAIYPNSNGNCPTQNVGCTKNVLKGAPAPAPAPYGNCKTAGWHPDMNNNKGCTNDDNYPEQWLQDSKTGIASIFFTTSKDCCAFLGLSGPSCAKVDRGCTIDGTLLSGGCNPKVWHPDEQRTSQCSNSKNYPSDWNSKESKSDMIFGSARACCTKYHMNNVCEYKDGCTGKISSMEITKAPTSQPTKRPTREPTQEPTKRTLRPTTSPTTRPTVEPDKYYIVHGKGTCQNHRERRAPYYQEIFYKSWKICCSVSFFREKCIEDMKMWETWAEWIEEGYTNPPTPKPVPTPSPTPSPISRVVVEITVFGTLQIDNLDAPSAFEPEAWIKLKNVMLSTISGVMAKSSMVHAALEVKVSTYAGLAFPITANRRKLVADGQGEYDDPKNHQAKPVSRRRKVVGMSQMLQFELVIPAWCDDYCQFASQTGFMGMLAFDDVKADFLDFINTGVFSSTLDSMGSAYGVIDGTAVAPTVISGTLDYRGATESDITWTPTFNPTVAMPTQFPTWSPSLSPERSPTKSPSEAPTTGAPTSVPSTICSALKWHYNGSGGCTNNEDYPPLWDMVPSIGSKFLYASLGECCQANNLETCIVLETCDLEAVSCGATGNNVYHPTTPAERACRNNKNYPDGWNYVDGFLFLSAEECCAAYYDDGLCFIKNDCN